MSLPARGAWIEINGYVSKNVQDGASLPARGAWIEIEDDVFRVGEYTVAPRTGSVD